MDSGDEIFANWSLHPRHLEPPKKKGGPSQESEVMALQSSEISGGANIGTNRDPRFWTLNWYAHTDTKLVCSYGFFSIFFQDNGSLVQMLNIDFQRPLPIIANNGIFHLHSASQLQIVPTPHQALLCDQAKTIPSPGCQKSNGSQLCEG